MLEQDEVLCGFHGKSKLLDTFRGLTKLEPCRGNFVGLSQNVSLPVNFFATIPPPPPFVLASKPKPCLDSFRMSQITWKTMLPMIQPSIKGC